MTNAGAEGGIGPIDPPAPEFYDRNDDERVCFLCGNPRYRPLYTVRHFGFPFRFQQCACGIIKQTPMPNERFFEWFYNSDLFFSAKEAKSREIWGFYDYFKDEPCRMATSRSRYARLARWFPRGRLRVLKIGPSTGTFLAVAKEHGHEAIGCDISERFVAYARDTYGVRIDRGRFERMAYDEGSFDVILLLNVIENVPNQVEFLSAVNRALKPGGLFVVNYVNMTRNLIAWLQRDTYFLYRPPICYAYPRPVMRRLLDAHGFTIEASLRDVRHLHLEKVLTLLRWRRALALARALGVHQRPFPVYAYPSRLVVARRRP